MRLRHSLFWKLGLMLAAFCLLLVWLVWTWGLQVERSSYFLDTSARALLSHYAAEAEQLWLRDQNAEAIETWQRQLETQENTWARVIGPDLRALGETPLTPQEYARLTFMRKLDWPMSRRLQDELPYVSIEFPLHPEQGRLVLQLPQRFLPTGLTPWTHVVTHGVMPVLLALALGLLLYWHLIVPLSRLRERAAALEADDLEVPLGAPLSRRHDELGELARAFDHLTHRLLDQIEQQRRLLRDLSHELRTPLARLRVASDSHLALPQLKRRLESDVQDMQQLVDDTLDLAWLDTERPRFHQEDISLLGIWEALVENTCFESGWAPDRLMYTVDPACVVRVNINGIMQALENLLRNAIRHSPSSGRVQLTGAREGAYWLIHLDDQGPGVPEHELENIFQPFYRLAEEHSSRSGFGLGLAIAQRNVRLQGGDLWARNTGRGLRMTLRLPAGQSV
ncbi:HAMP domain-containing protein [Pseudomonas luteola]|uniref:sensor histidine kinase n=1 Tax=Pseudomonas luteola TaxID=47886 RepID=UPI000F78EAB9|nr:sensor histidine kinase [Pseudomonas luteola]RRW43337.1 HAMP domain-containing protein [Pseudomonas luteola]